MDKYDEILLAWQKLNIRNVAELEAALNGYVVQFAYHSGKMENPNITYHDTCEIFDLHEEDRKLYYQSLEAFDVKEEIAPLKLFLKAELVKTWDRPRFLRHAWEAKGDK